MKENGSFQAGILVLTEFWGPSFLAIPHYVGNYYIKLGSKRPVKLFALPRLSTVCSYCWDRKMGLVVGWRLKMVERKVPGMNYHP